jgi:hypothetical protein
MAKPFKNLKKKMSPARRARAEAKAEQMTQGDAALRIEERATDDQRRSWRKRVKGQAVGGLKARAVRG